MATLPNINPQKEYFLVKSELNNTCHNFNHDCILKVLQLSHLFKFVYEVILRIVDVLTIVFHEVHFQNLCFCCHNFLYIFNTNNPQRMKQHLNIIKYVLEYCNSSEIKQMGKSQNGSFKKTKHAKFSEKQIFRIRG